MLRLIDCVKCPGKDSSWNRTPLFLSVIVIFFSGAISHSIDTNLFCLIAKALNVPLVFITCIPREERMLCITFQLLTGIFSPLCVILFQLFNMLEPFYCFSQNVAVRPSLFYVLGMSRNQIGFISLTFISLLLSTLYSVTCIPLFLINSDVSRRRWMTVFKIKNEEKAKSWPGFVESKYFKWTFAFLCF